jgi:hypothetical protein
LRLDELALQARMDAMSGQWMVHHRDRGGAMKAIALLAALLVVSPRAQRQAWT